MARSPEFQLEDLTGAGLAVVEDRGWAGVSVRAVAERLGVSPMALYRVVPDARRLRHAIADAATGPIQPDPDAGDLFATLHSWAVRAYRHLDRYPGLAAFVITEWTELPAWLDIVEALLERADAEDITGGHAVAIVNAVYAYVLVRCQLRDSAAVAPRRKLAPVQRNAARYPLIKQSMAEFATAQTAKHFALGLDVLVDGLRNARVAAIA